MREYYNQDCMEGMKQYPDKHFDLAIVDPPYGIGEDASHNNSGDRPTKKWRNPNSPKYKMFNDLNKPNKKYFDELFRVSINQIIWGGNNFVNYLNPSSGWIVWNKLADIKENLSMCELAYTSFNKKCNRFDFLWAGFKKAIQEHRIHPTQKPVALYKWLLMNYAKEGDLILDTHVGSASSLIACEELGFDYVGYELDKDYYEASVERIEQYRKQLKLAI